MDSNRTYSELNDSNRLDRDVLVLRVVEGMASEADWAALQAIADRDATIWTELAEARRCKARLQAAICGLVSVADRVDAPVDLAVVVDESSDVVGKINQANISAWRAKRVGTLGWGVAACLALALGVQATRQPAATPVQAAGFTAATPTFTTPDQAMDAYLEIGKQTGQVVGEMPQRYVIKKTPTITDQGDGYEVLYVRQVIERALVNEKDVFRLGTDELGRSVLVPTRPTTPAGAGPSPY